MLKPSSGKRSCVVPVHVLHAQAKTSWVCLHLIELHIKIPYASMILLLRGLKPVYKQKVSSPVAITLFNASIKDYFFSRERVFHALKFTHTVISSK